MPGAAPVSGRGGRPHLTDAVCQSVRAEKTAAGGKCLCRFRAVGECRIAADFDVLKTGLSNTPLTGQNNYFMARQQLDQLDYKILGMISENPRVPFLEVARECGVSGAAIHQRVQRLISLGIIRESDYLIDPNRIGFETCAYMGLYLQRPDQFEEVIDKLKKIPEVVECHYTTGQYDMFIKLYARNNAHLLDIIHDKLQPLGLARTESIISFKEAFRQPLPIDDLSSN